MDPGLSLAIHEVLPTEILEMIFKEHAMLEWEAPTIDGQVCRVWRRIVLSTPRAWSYFEIRDDPMPSMGEVRMRLHRSSSAPLHIDIRADEDTCQRFYDLFSDHHTRIASLRMRYGSQSFFERRDFPCMRLLDVVRWCPIRWGSMPKLQFLLLGGHYPGMMQLSPFSGPVNLPSLTYLSLGVKGMKSHINAPRLVIYHEGGVPARDSFNISLPSLVEYGVFYPKAGDSDPAKLHLSFPNIKRLAIRADELVLISFFTSLANQPHLLPALQTISVRARHISIYQGGEGVQKKIESLVLVRNEACAVNVVVYFETVPPFRIPIFLGLTPDRVH